MIVALVISLYIGGLGLVSCREVMVSGSVVGIAPPLHAAATLSVHTHWAGQLLLLPRSEPEPNATRPIKFRAIYRGYILATYGLKGLN